MNRCVMLSGLVAGVLVAQPGLWARPQPPVPATPTTAPGAQPEKLPPAKPVYDESADAKVQIAAAVARAKKENRRVLIQWGGNWCPWCIRLHELYRSDRDIAKTLMYEYDVVMVDTGGAKGKNLDLAEAYGADVKKHGYPFLTVLDADGKAIANQETEALEVKGADGKSVGVKAGHDPRAVLKFLTDHKADYRDARALLDKGIADAKASGRMVFMHFGAPWCGWCHRLEDWMARPEIAAILAKDFVDVKIDEDRTVGGKELEAKFGAGGKGIPWFAFLDGEGRVVADSDGPKGNTGFPSEAHEVEHFGVMLKKACRNITAAEIETLLQSLKPKPAKG